jgi:hypothetical protein
LGQTEGWWNIQLKAETSPQVKSEWVALKLQSFVTMAARYADISRGTQIASWRAKAEEKAKVAPRLTQVSIF